MRPGSTTSDSTSWDGIDTRRSRPRDRRRCRPGTPTATVARVSDIPPPPGDRPPPPPPPDLSRPPGYAAYDTAPTQGIVRRIGGLSTWLAILVGVVGVAALVSAVLSGGLRDTARDFRAGLITEDEFIESYLVVGLLGFVQLAATIAAFTLTIIVMYRMASNHRSLGRAGRWAPGWAIGGWFLPPLVLYVIPYLMFRELWKASDPDVGDAPGAWRNAQVSPVVSVWWVLYGLLPLGIIIAQFNQGGGAVSGSGGLASTTEALAESLEEQYALTLVAGVGTLAAAIAFIVMLRALSGRHRRVIGES